MTEQRPPTDVCLFHRDGAMWLPQPCCAGPWSASALHGGPVAALAVSVAEQLLPGEHLVTSRMTLELVRPVPMQPLETQVRLIKSGRRVNLVDVEILADGRHAALARVQRTSFEPVQLPPLEGTGAELTPPTTRPEDYAPPDPKHRHPDFRRSAFVGGACEMRTPRPEGIFAHGTIDAWLHVFADLSPGCPLSPAAAVCAAADCSNALGAPEAPGTATRFINADLTVHLVRAPHDRWVHMHPTTVWMDHGIGHTRCALADRLGMLGTAAVILPLANL